MSAIPLMHGIKQLVETELAAFELKYMQSAAPLKYATPKICIGVAVANNVDSDFPYVNILIPKEVFLGNELATYNIDIFCGVLHENKKDDPESYEEIISLTERVVAILNNNKIVSKMFKLADKIAYSFEITPNSSEYSLGAISLVYEKSTGRFNPSDKYE